MNTENTKDAFASEVGRALKEILRRIREMDWQDEPIPERFGCLYCKHYVRKEGYDQEWGRIAFFSNYCDKGLPDNYIVKGYLNDGGACPSFDDGDSQFIYMSEKERG